jgi:recombination protein RecT
MNDMTISQQRQQKLVEFKGTLSKLVESKDLALPSNVAPDAFRNAAIVAVQDNPQIMDCEPESVFKSIRKLAAAGLVPDGREAAMVPFNTRENGRYVKKCQAMPMVFGLIKMARRSGDVTDIRAHTVYQKEYDEGRFVYVVGDDEKLEHRPILFGEKGDAIAYYAIAKLKDGTVVRQFMDILEIEKIRKMAASQRVKGGNDRYDPSDKPIGIWKDHYEQMAHKTVIRRLTKRLDLSAEDMRHITMDDEPPQIRDVTPEEPQSSRRNLAQAIEDQDKPKPVSGEILEPEQDQKEAPEIDQNSLEYAEGTTAAKNDKSLNDCPHGPGTPEWMNWAAGWKAERDAEDEPDA